MAALFMYYCNMDACASLAALLTAHFDILAEKAALLTRSKNYSWTYSFGPNFSYCKMPTGFQAFE